MGVFVAGVPSSLARRTPCFSRSPSPSPFTPATQARASSIIGAGPETVSKKVNGTQFSVWVLQVGILDELSIKAFRLVWTFTSRANQNRHL